MIYTKATMEDIDELTELRIAYLEEDHGGLKEKDLEIVKRDLPDYFMRNLNKNIFGYVARNEREIVACALLPDFSNYVFGETFDVIYSSLSLMHFDNKRHFIFKVSELLNRNGTFCLSIDKNSDDNIDMSDYKLKIFPDKIDDITKHIALANMYITNQFETEFAHILVCSK